MSIILIAKRSPITTIITAMVFMSLLLFPIAIIGLALIGWLYTTYSSRYSSKEKNSVSYTPIKQNKYTYHEYLLSPEWKAKVALVKARDKVCQISGSTDRLEVHHITYDRLFNEDLEDLVLLSRKYHQLLHNYYSSYSHSNTYHIKPFKEFITQQY